MLRCYFFLTLHCLVEHINASTSGRFVLDCGDSAPLLVPDGLTLGIRYLHVNICHTLSTFRNVIPTADMGKGIQCLSRFIGSEDEQSSLSYFTALRRFRRGSLRFSVVCLRFAFIWFSLVFFGLAFEVATETLERYFPQLLVTMV